MKKIKFDFIKNARFTIIVSVILIAAGIMSLVIHGGLKLGIDFTGGKNIRLKVHSSYKMDSKKIRSMLGKIGSELEINTVGLEEQQEFFIYYSEDEKITKTIKEILISNIGPEAESNAEKDIPLSAQNKWKILSSYKVGPKMGDEFKSISITATILILIMILIYIGFRFEFKFGIAAILALIHDVVISVGFVSILGFKFDIPILAGILMIIGYSLNDTIVIFDRIREECTNLHLDKEEYLMVVNKSISKSLTRTFLTSVTTLLAVSALIFFGGVVLKPLAIIFFIGVIAGTYSSIFIASPVLVLWEKIFIKKKKAIKKKK